MPNRERQILYQLTNMWTLETKNTLVLARSNLGWEKWVKKLKMYKLKVAE